MGAIRVAVLGGGLTSAVGEVHRIAMQMEGRFQPVAGCFSRNRDVNAASAERWGVSAGETYTDLDTLLARARDDVDAVVILTPTPQHSEEIAACLELGIPVISEKSVATSAAQASHLDQIASRNSLPLLVTYNYSGFPMLRQIALWIREGHLGDIIAIEAQMPQEGYLRTSADGLPIFPQDWRRSDLDLPVLALDLGTHVMHLSHFLLDEWPESVAAVSSHAGNVDQVVDYASSLAKYSSGIFGTFLYTKVSLGHRNGLSIRILGSRASVTWRQADPEAAHMAYPNGEVHVVDRSSPQATHARLRRYERFKVGHVAGFIEAFANLYNDFAVGLGSDGMEGPWPLDEYGVARAAEGLAVLSKMHAASAESRWVSTGPAGASG